MFECMKRRPLLTTMASIGTVACAGCSSSSGIPDQPPKYTKYFPGPSQQNASNASFTVNKVDQLRNKLKDIDGMNIYVDTIIGNRGRRNRVVSEINETFGYQISEDRAIVYEPTWIEYTGEHGDTPLLILTGIDDSALIDALEASPSELTESKDYAGMTHYLFNNYYEIAIGEGILVDWGGGTADPPFIDVFKYTELAADTGNGKVSSLNEFSTEFKIAVEFLQGKEGDIKRGWFYTDIDSSTPISKNLKAATSSTKIIDQNSKKSTGWNVYSEDISSRSKDEIRQEFSNNSEDSPINNKVNSIKFIQDNVIKFEYETYKKGTTPNT